MIKQISLVESDLVDIVGYATSDEEIQIHSEWKGKFTPSTYKIGLRIITALREWCKDNGFLRIVTNSPSYNEKAFKYCTMFGFSPVGEQDSAKGKVIVYKMELVEE